MTPTKKMPPPGLTTAVGVGKKPEGAPEDMPKSRADKSEESGGKASPEDALVIREDQHCSDCVNYTPDSGECSKVEGFFAPQDMCLRYFRPMNGEQSEPDADDMGGASDRDEDDLPPSYGGR